MNLNTEHEKTDLWIAIKYFVPNHAEDISDRLRIFGGPKRKIYQWEINDSIIKAVLEIFYKNNGCPSTLELQYECVIRDAFNKLEHDIDLKPYCKAHNLEPGSSISAPYNG